MTYCVAIRLEQGLVLLADTRTNAGVDNISRFRKLFSWTNPGERAFAMLTSGNLAMTQAVMSLLQERMDNPVNGVDNLLTAPSMFRVAELVGAAMREVQDRYAQGLTAMNESGASTIVLAGQRLGGSPRLFMIYSAGNFIEAPDSFIAVSPWA
ncbi:MAG: peptidase, partial [Pseudomonadota bacterium]